MKRKLLAGLLTLCMAAGMAVPAAAATTPAEQEQGADGPKYTLQDHVLNKANNWDISNELIMPGESFTTQYDLDKVFRNCSCVTADYQYWKYVTDYTFYNAALYLGDPNTNAPHTPRSVEEYQLKDSVPDLSKLEPISEEYNAVDIMFGGNYEELQKEIGDNEIYENVKGQLEALANDPSASVRMNIGYVNNTGLPMLFVTTNQGGPVSSDELEDVEGWHVGHGGISWAYRYTGYSNIRFFEPYYEINYEGVEDYFTEEELAALPNRYYVQREEQQLVFPNPTRAGYHFREWSAPGYDGLILNMDETVTVEDGATIVTFDWEHNMGPYYYNAKDRTLTPKFDRGDTVTFNPNGGALKDGEKAVREIDLKSVENGQFFDIGEVVPVREGYTFVGWCTSPDCTDESLIANTASDEWINAYNKYDMQVYAKWEKNVTELTNSDTNVSISLTDGVPEDATLSADTIAQESVLESRPELKEELPGLLSIYDISVRQNGETLEIKDNPMTVKIPLNDHLKGYKYYQAVYLGDPLERFDAVVEGDFLVFETDHLSQYAILGSNTPFETSEKPTDPTDPTDPLTISFYYGGAEYGYYQMGWVDVGDIDTDAGRFYATRTIGHVENPGDEPVYTTIEGDINPADKSISSSEPDITMAHLYYDVEVADASSFTVPLPDGPEYRPEGAGFYYTFAAWMVKDGKGGYKALKGSVTAEDVRNAIETDESGNKSVVITAAFHSEIVDKDDLTNKTPSGEYPKYAVILRANGGTFVEDGSDHLYIKPQSMEFSGQDDFFVEATCPKPENGDMVFAGWYRDEACTDGPITYLSIYNDLKDEPYGAAPYAPIDLYAKWESKGAESGTTVKDLTASDTGVSISLTDGVPEDATLSADTIAQESVLGSRPELKEELPGLLSIYDISVRQNGETLEIKDNPMTVKIPLNDHLKGYKYYQAVYLGDPLERFDAVVEGDFLVFETDHLSQYAILGSNTPFETSEKPTDPTDPTDPTTPTDPTDPAGPTDPTTPTDPADPADPTDPAKPEQQGKPSEQIESPQTGDSSNMMLWIGLMLASCGGVIGMAVYSKRKKLHAK